MPASDNLERQAAHDACTRARSDYRKAKASAGAAYDRLDASPATFEYRSDWLDACRREAEAGWRVKQAETLYRQLGGDLADSDG